MALDFLAFNCPNVFNLAPQKNCNLDSEDAQGAAVLGDACDPVPCPQFSPEIQWDRPPPPPHGGCEKITETVKDLRLDPMGSHLADALKNPVETPVTVSSTRYRYCFDLPSLNVKCNSAALIGDNYLVSKPSRAAEGVSDYWHRIQFSTITPDNADVPLEYKTGDSYTRDWLWQSDIAYWQSTPWGASVVPDEPTGRFWTSAKTAVGMSQDIGTGVHTLPNSTTPASMLANHYESVSPKEEVTFCGSYVMRRTLPWRYCPQCGVFGQPGGDICPTCGPPTLRPFQDLGPFISRVIVQADIGGEQTEGVLLPEGDLGIAQGTLTPTLEQELSDGSVWLDGVEPSMLTGRGPFMPAAVALSADSTTLVHAAFESGQGFVSATDIIRRDEISGERLDSASLVDPPSPRAHFTGVYSHAAGQIFVVGGKELSTGSDSGDIWTLPLAGDVSWYRVPRVQYRPGDVLAATYLFGRGRLWVLDVAQETRSTSGSAHDKASGMDQRFSAHLRGQVQAQFRSGGAAHVSNGANVRDQQPPTVSQGPLRVRLVELDPASGAARNVGEWPRTDRFDQYWLVPDRGGQVLLAASSARRHTWIVARLDPATGNVTAFHAQPGELSAAPIVDSEGYWLIVRAPGSEQDSTLRLATLRKAHRSARDLGDCF